MLFETGSPHYVEVVDNIHQINVYEQGLKIRNSQKFKKNTPLIQHTRIAPAVNFGVPDVLCNNDFCGFFMVELKYTTTNKVRFSPHQILFHTQKSKRNFLLLTKRSHSSL